MNDVRNMSLNWKGEVKGEGSLEANSFTTPIAIPAIKGGTGGGANPKDLMIASASTCFLMTLVGMLKKERLVAAEIRLAASSAPAENYPLHIRYQLTASLESDATDDNIETVHRLATTANESCALGELLRKAGVKIDLDGVNISREV